MARPIFSDPARFSFAHGGKDRHPFPVPLKVYDETIRVLKSAVRKGKLGRGEELAALQRLDEQARVLDGHDSGHSVESLIAQEQQSSAGRTQRIRMGMRVRTVVGHDFSAQVSPKIGTGPTA